MESTGEKRNKKRIVWSVIAAVAIAACSFFAGFSVHYFTLDEEMRTLLRVKERIQKLYYYEIDDEKFYTVLFDAVNEDLLDAYSQYLTAEEYAAMKESATGAQQGIGVSFYTKTPSGEDQMLIASVLGNSPAEGAGLSAGERIVGFGDRADDIRASNDFQAFKAFVNGKATGETIYLRVVEQSGDERIVAVQKRAYVESYVYYKTTDGSYSFTGENAQSLIERGERLAALPVDTAYIRLTSFNGGAAEEFAAVMERFKTDGKKNLVLDLRGNGGGYLDILQKISSYFCKTATEKNPVVAVADFGEYRQTYKASDNLYSTYFGEDSRICVLADKNTASASECLLGVLLDYGAIDYGDICLIEREGEARTYGKGIMQTTYPFVLTGDALKLTTAKIRWPKTDTCIHGRGVLPSDGAKTVAEDTVNDGELTAAIARLFSK